MSKCNNFSNNSHFADYIRGCLKNMEENHQYEVSTETVRFWIDLWKEYIPIKSRLDKALDFVLYVSGLMWFSSALFILIFVIYQCLGK